MKGGYIDKQAPPVATKIQISDLPQNEYYIGVTTARSVCAEQYLSPRTHISTVKVADFLNTETKEDTKDVLQMPSPSARRLQVTRFRDTLEPRRSSPTGSASQMIHRACTPVTEIENNLPPVGQSRFEDSI